MNTNFSYSISIEGYNGLDISNYYITFIPSDTTTGFYIYDILVNGNPAANGCSFPISGKNISVIKHDWNGHIFISDKSLPVTYNAAKEIVDPPSDAGNHYPRFQMIELSGALDTNQVPYANPDISYINYFSIPMMIENKTTKESRGFPSAYNSRPININNLRNDIIYYSIEIFRSLDLLIKDNSGQVIRVLSPLSSNTALRKYPRFDDYINYVFNNNIKIRIENFYSGLANPTDDCHRGQNYWVNDIKYDGKNITMTGYTDIFSNFTIQTTGYNDSTYNDPFNKAIYYARADYSWRATSRSGASSSCNKNCCSNNVFDAILRDFYAGFAFGFIGSSRFPANSYTSRDWQKAQRNQIFSNNSIPGQNFCYYNWYAYIFNEYFSDVYAYPYSDFLSSRAPELKINNGDGLKITVLP